MKCQQCDRPALYGLDENGPYLCLNCYERFDAIQTRQFLHAATMANHALAELESIAPFGPPPAMIPVAELAAHSKGHRTLNNITISNSNVGVINTGDLAQIDAIITQTKGSDAEAIGNQIKVLTQSIIDTNQLAQERKQEILDLIKSLGDQVTGERKPSVIRALLTAIREPLHSIEAVVSLFDGLSASIERLFGS